MSRFPLQSIALVLLLSVISTEAFAQVNIQRKVPCCELYGTAGVVWVGEDSLMSLQKLAAYCAPALEFSPDEPLLRDINDRSQINVPMAFPFEKQSAGPVMHYRVRSLLTDKEGNPVASAKDWLPGAVGINRGIEPGKSLRVWMKLPAPPPEVTTISLFLNETDPIEDVPITDK